MWECVLVMLFSLSLVRTSDSILSYRSFFRYEEDAVEGVVEMVMLSTIGLFSFSLLGTIATVVFDISSWLYTEVGYIIMYVYLTIYFVMKVYHITLYLRYKRLYRR